MTGGQVSGGELAHQLSCNRSLRLGERKRPTTSPADDCTDVVSSLFLNERGVHGEDWGGGVGRGRKGGRGGEEKKGLGRKTERWMGKGREIKGPRGDGCKGDGKMFRQNEKWCPERMGRGVHK